MTAVRHSTSLRLPDFKIFWGSQSTDLGWAAKSILTSYWGKHLTFAKLARSLDRSLVANGTCGGGKQIAIVRVVTDCEIFSSITDVFVDEVFRKLGVGTAMMQAVIERPEVRGTLCILRTRPENVRFYKRFGFVGDGPIMQRPPTPA